MNDKIDTILDQIDSELNFSPSPSLAYLRGKLEELKLGWVEFELDTSEIDDLQDEVDELEDKIDELEDAVNDYKNHIEDIKFCIKNEDLSEKEKISHIKELIENI